MVISGQLEYGDERYNVGIICRNKLVRVFVLIEMLEFMDDDVDCTLSWFFVQLLMKMRGKMERVLPSCLAMYGGSAICMTEVVPESLHVVLGIG